MLLALLPWFCGQASAAALSVGLDMPFQAYLDRTGRLGTDEFLALSAGLPTRHRVSSLGYSHSILWVRVELPAALFAGGERWLQLAPVYLDHVILYYRPLDMAAPWVRRQTGAMELGPIGDLDYRLPVFRLPPPPAQSRGYEVVVRVQSTSALLVQASLWRPDEFLAHAASSTAFWGFYFGLAAMTAGLALLFALVLRRRLFWSVFACSAVTYLVVACLQGYVDWLLGRSVLHLQRYMVETCVLLSYGVVLWMGDELVNLAQIAPRVHKVVMGCALLNLPLLLSIPLGFYGSAVQLQGVFFAVGALIFTAAAVRLWRRGEIGASTLVLGLLPGCYLGFGLLALLALYGLVPFYETFNSAWQYVVMANMMGVLGMAVVRVRAEDREVKEKWQLARELAIEREASFHQRQFIGMVSHEFRTPLAIISGALANLGVPTLSEEQRHRRHERIRRATDRLVQLTDNCLADARLSADSLYLDLKSAGLLDLARTAAAAAEVASPHSLRLTLQGRSVGEGDEAVEQPRQMVDTGLLRIAILNLLDNALKYSPGGLVAVDVSCRDESCVLSVEDQGSGIPSDQAEQVFERYRRASTSMNVRGAGLGLYVARQVARAHGGDLVLAANGPGGCRFELRLPTRAAGAGA